MAGKRVVSALLAGMLCAWTLPASAEDGALGTLRGGINALFGSQTEAVAKPADGRRVPFSQSEIQLSFAPLVAQAGPAVVNVYAEQRQQAQRSPFAGDPFFEQFFGNGFFNAPPRVQSSLGSGVILSSDGLIVTNFHVIEGADDVRVALADGREFQSSVLLADKSLDLAILRVSAGEDLPVLPIGDSDAIATGDLVLAIGNPFGVGQTTTSGIISATARSHAGISDFGFFIQTDAAINPGNSGGALIDMNGRLIGINTAIFSRSGGSNGIGFAIPSNMVGAVVSQAAKGSNTFVRPWIGADFDAVTAEIADGLGMKRPYGAIVTRVAKDGPAAVAGLKPGDVILSVEGVDVENPDALGYRLAIRPVGESAAFGVMRSGKTVSVSVTPTVPPVPAAGSSAVIEGRSPFAGARIEEVETREGLRVVITDLDRASPAARAGFRPGDVIIAVNRVTIDSVPTMLEAAAADTRWWRFSIGRNGGIINQVLRF